MTTNKKIVYSFLTMVATGTISVVIPDLIYGSGTYGHIEHMPGYYIQDAGTFWLGWFISFVWTRYEK